MLTISCATWIAYLHMFSNIKMIESNATVRYHRVEVQGMFIVCERQVNYVMMFRAETSYVSHPLRLIG